MKESTFSRNRYYLESIGVFVATFLWFWFWRPYGFFGGDSEIIERRILRGEWFVNRVPFSIASFQLSHQIFGRLFQWPVAWSISLVSCLAGAAACVALSAFSRRENRPWLAFFLVVATGHSLSYHGALETYALVSLILALWILSVWGIQNEGWPTGAVAFCFTLGVWFHLMFFALAPALGFAAWVYRRRILEGEWRVWLVALGLAAGVVLFSDLLAVGIGPGFNGIAQDFLAPGKEDFSPLFSIRHLQIKAYFLWVACHVSLPLAFLETWNHPRDRFNQIVGSLAVCGLFFDFLFHPDLGYEDWDLFLLPSLPIACLGARYIIRSPRFLLLSSIWFAAYFSIWFPWIPVWANLPERGLASVEVSNFPENSHIHLDDRYPIEGTPFYVRGGTHSVSVQRSGYLKRWKVFRAEPGEKIEMTLPEADVPSLSTKRIEAMEDEELE